MSSPAVGGPLRLDLDAVYEDVFEPGFVPDAPILRFEAVSAYARLFGLIRLDATRLTDLLNASQDLHLHEAAIENLVDGTTRKADDVVVPRGELVAVVATGPRGDPALRRWTRSYPVALETGPF